MYVCFAPEIPVLLTCVYFISIHSLRGCDIFLFTRNVRGRGNAAPAVFVLLRARAAESDTAQYL
jgi:hypothetical protein